MERHVFTITEPAKQTPKINLPDGLITGNGDVTVTLAGGPDRVRVYIGKADFWKADEPIYRNYSERIPQEEFGGLCPLGLAELLLPHMAWADYRAEQDMDGASISLHVKDRDQSADLRVTVCATENTILFELDRSFPMVSASIALLPMPGPKTTTETGEECGVQWTVRGFDDPEFRFPTWGICALKEISRVRSEDGRREKIVWAVAVSTNHDTAAYRYETVERVGVMTEEDSERLLAGHAEWWRAFWSKSGVSLPGNEDLELYWYSGIYACACCMRNKKFPPGIWGAYATADGMQFSADYHLNYNYEAPFYALTASNHPELLECYMSPITAYLPRAERYAREFLGTRGCLYPVGIGPLGLECLVTPYVKEHGRLFHGQKSNASYVCVVPMMHWYATRDVDFVKREYYGFLRTVAEFWEDYLVFEDGRYQIYNDALNEVDWYMGPRPDDHEDAHRHRRGAGR